MTAPERIQRYSVSNPFGADGETPDAAGEWVKWKDYATLLSDKERLERERDEQGDVLARHLLARAEAAEARVRSLEEALQLLMDVQNGPPLVTYEAQWNEAMARARAALSPREEGKNG